MRDITVESEPAASAAAMPWTTRDLWWLLAIAAVAAVVRLVAIELWSWSDAEATTWRAVTEPIDGLNNGFMVSDVRRYPVGFLLLRWLIGTGLMPGYTEGWLRLPFAFAGTLAVPLLALLARRRVGNAAAVLAAVVLAVHPAHVAASQTADPIVLAVTLAMLAGVLAANDRLWPGALAVVLAGAVHPVGWLVATGLVFAALDRLHQRIPMRAWWGLGALLLLAALPLWGAWLEQVRMPVVVLAVVGLVSRPRLGRALGVAVLLPLAVGGLYWGFDNGQQQVVVLGSLPALVLLAAGGAVHFYGVLHGMLERVGPLPRVVAAAPMAVLVGELITALFLYFAVFGGGRLPWRDLQQEALRGLPHGVEMRLVADRGLEVLRAYLRPNHWLHPDDDPHPGREVVSLFATGRSAAQVANALADPGAMLALRQDEFAVLRGDERYAALLQNFAIVRVWPCPQPSGDGSLYLLRRARQD